MMTNVSLSLALTLCQSFGTMGATAGATASSRPSEQCAGQRANEKLRYAASISLAAFLCAGCGGGGKNGRDGLAKELAEKLGCSSSYTVGPTVAPVIGKCSFRGLPVSIITFQNNADRNSYICSTCGFGADTAPRTVEETAHRLGGNFVAGDRYLVRVPNAQAEQAVKGALGRTNS